MYHYLFTNDLRISSLKESLINAGTMFLNDSVPSATENKSVNNNATTLGFYFNLTKESNCSRACSEGQTRKVVLNFIKKFQFPNPRTDESMKDAYNDGILIAPLRIIIQTLYTLLSVDNSSAFLTRDEIKEFIFYNDAVAKTENPDLLTLAKGILNCREGKPKPASIKEEDRFWKHEERQIREMLKVLSWSGCVKESNDKFFFKINNSSAEEKAFLLDILLYKGYWRYDSTKTYDENRRSYQRYMDLSSNEVLDEGFAADRTGTDEVTSNSKAVGGINKIYYGAPGCGKSYYVKRALDEIGVVPKNRIRVTFHPEYSNSDFVGQILPSIEEKYDDETGEKQEIVKYSFFPGPFTLALLQSYRTNEMVYLIIEEINRGNAAAIFGDLFQLLDREKDESKPHYSESEYPIDNPNIQKYLADTLRTEGIDYDGRLVIPSNLTIFATMNSSDQNVFTMDTAFKRRWTFEQISNDINADNAHSYKNWFIPGTDITWSVFLTKVNDRILENKIYNQTNEDKRMGKYFVTKDCLSEEQDSDDQNAANNFAYKVLEYLWNDVCKIGKEDWFDTVKYRTLEDLIQGFLNPAPNCSPLSVFQNIEF